MSDRGASMPAELVTSLHVVVCVFAGKTSNSLLSIHCVDRYSQTDVEDTQLADGLLSLAFRSLGERFSVRASWTAVLHQCFAGRLYNRIFRLEKQYCSRETGSTTLLSAVSIPFAGILLDSLISHLVHFGTHRLETKA
ncbi:hypothetical protein RvY_14497-2 [Ramazzottius varieornatus]|uniref:Uncharacterized protein n=1 Tax=Ramazzottius varieornatus TaxID=947166 RepID=A0A1D1VRI7_RAMVA|nr:hypothetical protein RvY_14497-2 [Ramazzottius varieornatus]